MLSFIIKNAAIFSSAAASYHGIAAKNLLESVKTVVPDNYSINNKTIEQCIQHCSSALKSSAVCLSILAIDSLKINSTLPFSAIIGAALPITILLSGENYFKAMGYGIEKCENAVSQFTSHLITEVTSYIANFESPHDHQDYQPHEHSHELVSSTLSIHE